jgi:hypothetical protein
MFSKIYKQRKKVDEDEAAVRFTNTQPDDDDTFKLEPSDDECDIVEDEEEHWTDEQLMDYVDPVEGPQRKTTSRRNKRSKCLNCCSKSARNTVS